MNADENRTDLVGKFELYKEERDVLREEMKKVGECEMEKLGHTCHKPENNQEIISNRCDTTLDSDY